MKKVRLFSTEAGWALEELTGHSGYVVFWQQVSKEYKTVAGIRAFCKRKGYSVEELSEVARQIDVINKKKQARFFLNKVQHAEAMLSEADNNLLYITALRNLYFWLNKLHMMQDYLGAYYRLRYFENGVHSFYEKVYYSLQDYKYGNRPF